MTVYPDGFSLSLSIFQQILYLTHPCGGQCGLLNTSHCLRSEAGDFIRDARARQTSLLWATWTQTPPSTPNQLPACRLLTLPEPLKSGRFYSDGGIWTVFSKPNSLIIPLFTVQRWWLTSCEEWSLRGCIVFFNLGCLRCEKSVATSYFTEEKPGISATEKGQLRPRFEEIHFFLGWLWYLAITYTYPSPSYKTLIGSCLQWPSFY